ncbi:hypothetical protein AYJ57_02240 [Salipiger sp. CCB-MM3]|uniref:BatD family protein n=1 Tax=Salipiger sp. CCB-MM3 TaxID=1792508 RepID=UPI00080A959B|nr:BatD family protein [Salipiger sp. CCB-MM3]ANT59283.1 hypothetical protein AYJ57_02240 [Salipiger sp. CCB-MM3]
MIRWLLRVLTVWLAVALVVPAAAQEADAPQLRVDFPEDAAIPGQPLSLRLTVLVPTFMPKPPVWPSFEAPNLLVRLPGRATNPTSERVNGETWAGVSRRYTISPMVPGSFTLPPQDILITWQDPETGAPRESRLPTPPIAFSGEVPEGAEGLDPFIAAADLTLTQEIEGELAMVPGNSLTRRLTVEVQGVSPMFLPQMLEPAGLPGLAAYPDAPQLSETEERGLVSGSRTESITYVAEAGGGGALPEVRLEWYDIDDGAVKTATAEALTLEVDGPPPERDAPRDWRLLALLAGLVLLGALALFAVLRWLLPVLRARRQDRQARRLASEVYAWRGLQRVIARRDHQALRPALDLWAGRVAGSDPRRAPEVEAALLLLGAARYGTASGAAEQGWAKDWAGLQRALSQARAAAAVPGRSFALPPLNPGRA